MSSVCPLNFNGSPGMCFVSSTKLKRRLSKQSIPLTNLNAVTVPG
jgi:hypothetical protein